MSKKKPRARSRDIEAPILQIPLVDSTKRVIIQGWSQSASVVSPTFNDGGWETWAMNVGDPRGRAHRLFALHDRRTWRRDWSGHAGITKDARTLTLTPFYVWEPKDWPDVPTATRYPRETVEALTARGRYHQSSFDYMLCLAIVEDYEHVHLAGVDFGPWDGSEPQAGRACLEYWIAVAEGRSIKVTVAEPTTLFKTINYVRHTTPYGAPNFRHVYDLSEDEVQRIGGLESPYWWVP